MVEQYKPADFPRQGLSISALISELDRAGNIQSMESIGSRVRSLRKSRRMTQAALATAIGVKQSAISQIETGETNTLSGEVLAALCRELTTTPEFLLSGAGSAEDFESAMQIAEVSNIMRRLPAQAREELLNQARLLARATLPASASDPFGKPTPHDPLGRRVRDEAVEFDRRKH